MAIDLPCDWQSAFQVNPAARRRCGYLVAFEGLDLPPAQEQPGAQGGAPLVVFTPYRSVSKSYGVAQIEQRKGEDNVRCIGVIDHFGYGGGRRDPICISAHVCRSFADQLKARQKASLTSTAIKKLGWWIINHDAERNSWFEEAFPLGAVDNPDGLVSGHLRMEGRRAALQISDEPTPMIRAMDLQLFQLYFEVLPPPVPHNLHFAQSSLRTFVKPWAARDS